MIWNVARTALIALRRDRGAMVLSFVLPLAFFTHFRGDFREGEQLDAEGHVNRCRPGQERGSENLVRALEQDGSLWVHRSSGDRKGRAQPALITRRRRRKRR